MINWFSWNLITKRIKKTKYKCKKEILCTFVAFFLLRYRNFTNITASPCFVETSVVSEQDMAIDLDKHVLEKILTWLCDIYLVCKIHIFHQLMKSLGYVLIINTQYFKLPMQKETKYVGWKVVILNYQLCHM